MEVVLLGHGLLQGGVRPPRFKVNMESSRYNEGILKSTERLLGYFDQQVLASYQNEPDKYRIMSDSFEGELGVTNEYYCELENSGSTDDIVSIRFGYRTLKNGNVAIAAWLPDLFEKSRSHIQRWRAFHLKSPDWTTDKDERFEKWVMRYLEGNWEIDNGPLYSLGQAMRDVNSLTKELVGLPLYMHEVDETLGLPVAENTHRYQDSHKALYGYLIDGLDKACISRLASQFGKPFTFDSKNTICALTMLFPDLRTASSFPPAVELVSQQRRLASHGVRPRAVNFPAISQFTKDISLCVEAVKELLFMLERDSRERSEEPNSRP